MNHLPIGFHIPSRFGGTLTAVLLFLLWFAFPTTQAASFDCSKAATSVEKQICADDELSRLDSSLDSVYRSELTHRHGTAREQFIKDQARWLRDIRDVCVTQRCIRDAYFARISTLDQIDERHIKWWKYPPYPDIWGREFSTKECEVTVSGAWYAPNGDILIRYMRCPLSKTSHTTLKEDKSLRVFGYHEFFSNKDHLITEGEYNNFRNKFSATGSPARTSRISAHQVHGGSIFSYVSSSICTDGPYAGYYELKSKNGVVLWRKHILVRGKPRKVICNFPESVDYELTFNVDTAELIWLRDSTFLMRIDDAVLRFDSQLNTRYPYDRKRIYIIDHEAVQAVIERAKKRCDPYEPCLDGEMKKYLDSLK